jgi:hypothetical protein
MINNNIKRYFSNNANYKILVLEPETSKAIAKQLTKEANDLAIGKMTCVNVVHVTTEQCIYQGIEFVYSTEDIDELILLMIQITAYVKRKEVIYNLLY